MKLLKLSAPRSIVIRNDDAYEAPFVNPGILEDDAADQAKADHARAVERWAAWCRYLDNYDLSQLEPFLKPGAKPVIFKVRVLPPDAHAAVIDTRDRAASMLLACRYGVVDILNLEYVDELGGRGTVKSKHYDGPFGTALDEFSMSVFNDVETLAEVGAHCLAAGRLPKELHKSG